MIEELTKNKVVSHDIFFKILKVPFIWELILKHNKSKVTLAICFNNVNRSYYQYNLEVIEYSWLHTTRPTLWYGDYEVDFCDI